MKVLLTGIAAIIVTLLFLALMPSKIETLMLDIENPEIEEWHMDLELADDGIYDPLRGNVPIDVTNKAPRLYKTAIDKGPVARNYLTQPPVIPHKIKGYEINLRSNKCMICHSWKNYREWGATKISITHFKDRDGKELSDISPLRYFCTQCHVPQSNAEPLVINTFQPTDAFSTQ